MIRDTYLKALFIPLLGIIIPLLSGIITFTRYSVTEIIAANLFFILTSFIIWAGCNWVHSKLRIFYKPGVNPFFKILTICAVSALYGSSIGGLLTITWVKLSKEGFSWSTIIRFIVIC